jgi:hypothetical protein
MEPTTAQKKKLNAQFTNDEYWLLFPLHLKWDKGYKLSGGDTARGVISNAAYRKYIIQYNDKDGFTPGDMYDLFVDEKNVVREWAFHKGGSKEPSLITSWDSYTLIGVSFFDGQRPAYRVKSMLNRAKHWWACFYF